MLDQMFHRIMRGLVETGRAPHYAELARALSLSVEDGRRLLLEVMQAYPIGWLHPETDYIASFPPLNNLPTQYRISVRGEQKWFAQCGFEATSATWLFPGRTVRIEAPCLDCGRVPAARVWHQLRWSLCVRDRSEDLSCELAGLRDLSIDGH